MEITQGSPVRTGAPVSTRSTIIAAARRLLNRDGAGNVTLEAAAAEAGVPLETVSVHFKDKQDLLIGLAADDMNSLASAMRGADSPDEPPASPARIIEHVARPDERVLARLERRMQMLERAFADAVDRHAKAKPERAGPIKESDFASHEPLEVSEMTEDQNAHELPPVMAAPDANAPEAHGESAAADDELPPVIGLPPVMEAPSASGSKPPSAGAPAVPHGSASVSRDYLSAARRAATSGQPDTAKSKQPPSGAPPAAKAAKSRVRVLIYGCAAPLVILAVSVMVLNRNTVTAEQADTASVPPAAAAPAPARPPAAPAPQQQAVLERPANPVAPVPPPAVDPQPPAAQAADGQPVEVLIQGAQLGDAKAERDLGLRYLTGKGIETNEAEAARWLMQSAYQGEPTSEYWLGTLYSGGKGVPADGFQAKHWYEAAAKKGNVKAMHSLALAEFDGKGMDRDARSAILWFTKAAELGLRPSQYNLGNIYEQGNGVSRNLVEAYKWYAIAAAKGDHDADVRLTAVSSQLKPEELAQAKEAVTSFKPTAQDPSAN